MAKKLKKRRAKVRIPSLRPVVPGATGANSPPQLHQTPQQQGGTAADVRHLTPRQIGQVVLRQGGPQDPDALAHIIAIVMCESSGNWDSVSSNPDGGTNRGGWQIDDKAHPQYSSTCLHSVICSTNAAKDISGGFKDFSAWACSGADPTPFRDAAHQALGDLGTVEQRASSNPLLDSIAGPLGGIAQFFAGLGELLLTPDGWVRIGKLLLGAVLVVWGLGKLTGRLGGGKVAKAGRSTASKIGTAAAAAAGPEGLAAKAAAAGASA